MNTKVQFQAIRRAYRCACKLNAASCSVRDGQAIIATRVAACSALRAFTGKWDTCEPAGSVWCGVMFYQARMSGKNKIRVPFVSAASVRWMRADCLAAA